MAFVKFSSFISKKFNLAQDELNVPAKNLERLFKMLDREVSGLKEFLFTETGEVKPFIAIFVNDEKIENIYNNISLNKNDSVLIINMIAGG